MAKLTVSAAAKSAGISRQTLYTGYINTGKITVGNDERGNRCIDTSEIMRVFGKLQPDKADSQASVTDRHNPTSDMCKEIAVLQAELNAAHEQLTEKDDRIRELRDDKAWFKAEVEKLTDTIRQIEHKPADTPAAPEAPTEPEYRPSWIVRALTKRLW